MRLFFPFIISSCFLGKAYASPWLLTQYVAVSQTLEYDPDYDLTFTETTTLVISPTGTDPPVVSTTTFHDYYTDLTGVNLFVAPTAGAVVTPAADAIDFSGYVSATFSIPDAPCTYRDGTVTRTLEPQITTIIPIDVPYGAIEMLRPTETVTSTFTNYRARTTSKTMFILDPTDVPSDVFYSASTRYEYLSISTCRSSSGTISTEIAGDGSHYGDGFGGNSYNDNYDYYDCQEFTWYISGSAFSGGYCCDDGCHYTWGIPPWALGVTIFFGWFGLFLIIGLVESWFVFRKAMLGHKARRGLPYGFAWLCPILSCIALVTVKKYPAKTPEQQAFLAAKWNEMSGGHKFGLWTKNFFRRRDPSLSLLGLQAPVSQVQAPSNMAQDVPFYGTEPYSHTKAANVTEGERT